jgi:hypothetical protein
MRFRAQALPAWYLALAIAMTLAASPAQGQEDTEETPSTPPATSTPATTTTPPPPLPVSTAAVDPGHVVYYDLATGRFLDPLPFDVQFYLRVPVEDSFKSLTGRYVGDTKPFLCQDAFPRTRVYTDFGFGPRQTALTERRQEQPIGMARIFDDAGKKHAELNVVNGLLPNRYYCFELTYVREAEEDPKIFRQALRSEVDMTLRRLEEFVVEKDRVSRSFYELLRRDIIGTVDSQLKPGERLIVTPGSFLDDQTMSEDLVPESKKVITRLIEVHRIRGLRIERLERNAASVVPAMHRILGNTELAEVRKSAQEPVPEDLVPVFRGREETLQRLIDLDPVAPDTGLAALALGDQSFPGSGSAPEKPLDESWAPADLDVRRANLKATLDAFGELHSLVSEIGRSQELRTLAAGPDADLTSLNDDLRFVVAQLEGAIQLMDDLSGRLSRRQELLTELVSALRKEVVVTHLVEGTTNAAFDVRVNWYMGMDLGAAWSRDIEDIFTYVGANIYFRPVNKKAPLRWSDFRKGQAASELMKRLSITLGVTVNELVRDGQFQGLSQDKLTQGLIADRPMVVAAGFRLSDFFRLSAGALVFKDRNPDPLVDERRLAWSPLVSLSIDWDVRNSLRDRLLQRP